MNNDVTVWFAMCVSISETQFYNFSERISVSIRREVILQSRGALAIKMQSSKTFCRVSWFQAPKFLRRPLPWYPGRKMEAAGTVETSVKAHIKTT